MPIHDWTRVEAGIFHDFHLTWIGILKNALNCVLLPSDYYALAEQIDGGIGPDLLSFRWWNVGIRHVSNHRLIALMEILSQGNKAARYASLLLDKAASALARGIHLFLVDLHPPGPNDPRGIHSALWERHFDAPVAPFKKPLTLAAYVAEPKLTAYVEPVAVGDTLPDMPLFLNAERYINVPLEATYRAAYEGVPRYYRTILETGADS
jgi:hypothetical protein